jgi:UDP-glucose 4-epimerase
MTEPTQPAGDSWQRGDLGRRLEAFYRGRRVLITGGASFIGSHLAEVLVAAGARLVIADDLSSGSLENLARVSSAIRFLEGDLRETAFASEACADQEIVFHLAAAHGGRGYIDTHPVECLGNMSLDYSVFAAAARAGCRKIVFASSACVYPTTLQRDDKDRPLLRESDATFDDPGKTFPDGEYGWAKLMGELQLRAFSRQHGLAGIACRLFTAYGERENESHAVIALIAKARARLDPYPIWGDGLQTRNFTYVRDTVTGMALSGACLDGFQTINVGTDAHYTILALIEEIFAQLGWRPRVIQRELERPIGVRSRAADTSRCREQLGWAPETTLRDGVRRTISWYVPRFGESRADRLEHLLMERS